MKKQLLVSSILIAAMTSVIAWLVGRVLVDNQLEEIRITAASGLAIQAAESAGFLTDTSRLLHVMATSEQLKRAMEIPEQLDTVLAPTLERVIRANPNLHQIRWIDEQGQERLRFQRNGDSTFRTPAPDLQDKSDRYYFTDAMAKPYGELYFSDIDLNVEFGAVELPYRPMVRIATRVADTRGNSRGILIVNDNLLGWFANLNRDAAGEQYFVINHQGDWLKGLEPALEWGFMFGQHHRLEERFPQTWKAISSAPVGQWLDEQEGLMSWHSVDLSNRDNHWVRSDIPVVTLLHRMSPEALSGPVLRQWVIVGSIAAVLGSLVWGLWASNLVWQERRRQMKRALEKSELEIRESRVMELAQRRIRNMVENNVNGFLIIDSSGVIVQVNSALEDMFGYDAGELIGESIGLLVPASAAHVHQGFVRNFTRNPRKTSMANDRRVQGKRKDGSEFQIEVVLNPLFEDGVVEIAATVIDITERIQRDQDIQTYAQAFMAAGEAIAILDKEGRLTHVNHAFIAMTGYSECEAIGMAADQFLANNHSSGGLALERFARPDSGDWSGQHLAQRKDGSTFPIKLEVSVDKDPSRQCPVTVLSFLDITELEAANQKLERLALYDPLTGLPNRTLLLQMVESSIARTCRRRNKFALMFIDLDNFKLVNDGLGHHAGDQLLIKVAEILKSALRTEDTVARLGGDEFVVLLEGIDTAEVLVSISMKLMKRLNVPFVIDGESIRVTASMGVCMYPDDGLDYTSLLRKADAAMYQAKESGKDGFQFFQQDYSDRSTEILRLDFQLHQAIETDQLFLVYQPQYELHSGKLCGVEALVRWRHPERGVIPPGEFIPLAEKVALLDALENWVFEHACAQAGEWAKRGLDVGRVSINLTGYRINKGAFKDDLLALMNRVDCKLDAIEIEITEDYIVQRAQSALKDLEDLRSMGIQIAVDDFGTGYSSLSYLKELPIDKLKIDRSFIVDLEKSEGGQKIVTALLAMARELGLTVVAEGVENKAQADLLKSRGCYAVQGFLFSQPLSPQALELQLSGQNVVMFNRDNNTSS